MSLTCTMWWNYSFASPAHWNFPRDNHGYPRSLAHLKCEMNSESNHLSSVMIGKLKKKHLHSKYSSVQSLESLEQSSVFPPSL